MGVAFDRAAFLAAVHVQEVTFLHRPMAKAIAIAKVTEESGQKRYVYLGCDGTPGVDLDEAVKAQLIDRLAERAARACESRRFGGEEDPVTVTAVQWMTTIQHKDANAEDTVNT